MGERVTTFCSQGELKKGLGRSLKYYHGGHSERAAIGDHGASPANDENQ